MKTSGQTNAEQLKAYCARIGADPLLVQGAGGNVSWKDDKVLWVKATGTWLARAEENDIFIQVDLAHLRIEIAKKNFSATPKLVGDSSLRPSIETLLHALMPHKVVVHLHAVEILAHLVRESPLEDFKKLIGDSVKWVFVDYFKPGADLAQAVAEQLVKQSDADVVFLKSHGLVIGGADVESIERTLGKLLSLLQTKTLPFTTDSESETLDSEFQVGGYVPCGDKEINQLATKKEFAARLLTEWALYPDHVVFLGEQAFIVDKACDLSDLLDASIKPHFIFFTGQGVFESESATNAHKAQLRCYYDVIVRQPASEKLHSLTSVQVAELLNWDAEKYRKSLSDAKMD
jgi:rhamnose utilization protein RhaD (predicted bifunctional aldolase and dehydrogenase)